MKKTIKNKNKMARLPKAPAGFHYHSNGGGLVANTAHAAATAFIGPEARVQDQAFVMDQARVTGKSVLSKWTFVGGDAVIDGLKLDHGIHLGSQY